MPSVSSQNEDQNLKSIKNLPRQQKMALVFLAVFTILIIIFSFLLFYTKLNKPFDYSGVANTNIAATVDLSKRDSDGDGLSDYDEINNYRTSPYLEDSDSDGISDKEEITRGTDPNCPTGQICNGAQTTLDKTASTSTQIMDNLSPASAAIDSELGLTGGDQEVTPAILRQTLLDSGYDKAELDQITDDELMKSYQEALKQNAANAASSTIVNQ